MDPTPLIVEQLQLLDPVYRDFITSETFSDIVFTFAEAHKLDTQQGIQLENGFFFFFSFLFDDAQFSDFVQKNCNLAPAQTIVLLAGFMQAIPPTVTNYYQANLSAQSEINLLTLDSDLAEEIGLSEDIAEAEMALRAIPALRTMSGSREFTPESGEPVYSTTQSAIINESLHVSSQTAPLRAAPIAPAPTPAANSVPGRWDSEQS